ncbi:MAG: gliding motility lipoprotein GldD [Bacteroidota bacterium]
MINKSLLLLSSLYILSCNHKTSDSQDYSPKPKGYNRIEMPKVAYQKMTEKHPYYFEYSKYARLLPDTFAKAEPHWIYIDYPTFGANVQLTYKPINGDLKRLQNMIGDAHTLSYKHSVKAYSIQEKIYQSPSGNQANVIDLEGEVPSQVQFYMTDSTRHFLRGALYFKTSMQNDSLAPVIQYIRNDILHLVNTLEWKK